MESMQAEPNIQKSQDKSHQETHNNSIMKHQNTEFEVSKNQDHLHHHHQEPQKRVTESKNEEKQVIKMAKECENGEDVENMEMKESDRKRENKKNNNNNNGGGLGPRDRLKKHRREVAGQVWIPDMWGHESFLKEWVDCTAFDASLMPKGIMLARSSLMEEARRANSNSPFSLRLERSSC